MIQRQKQYFKRSFSHDLLVRSSSVGAFDTLRVTFVHMLFHGTYYLEDPINLYKRQTSVAAKSNGSKTNYFESDEIQLFG